MFYLGWDIDTEYEPGKTGENEKLPSARESVVLIPSLDDNLTFTPDGPPAKFPKLPTLPVIPNPSNLKLISFPWLHGSVPSMLRLTSLGVKLHPGGGDN